MGAMDTSAATPMAANATVPMGAMDTSATTPMAAKATAPMGAIVPGNDRYGAETMDASAPAARGAATTEMVSGFVYIRIRA